MPILKDHPKEIDITHTPLEKRRREEMGLRNVRYGMYKVAKDQLLPILCYKCGKEIMGEALIIFGRISHYRKCV